MAEQRESIVGVLGPVRVGGTAPSRRQRSILAALALHGGATSRDRLIDAVWAGQAPRSARQSLQNQIARLRATFGDDLIVTEPGGYRLGWTCDVASFESLIGPHLGRAPSHAAVEPLTAALALWRGTPFADLDDVPGLDAARARLEEMFASGAEQLAACRLRRGADPAILGELHSLVAEEPYRERRWALLMTALHRAGRSAEAIDAFDRMAAVLDTDLRARPSNAIRRLRDAIGAHDVLDLDAVGLVPSPEAPATPQPSGPCHRRLAQRRQRTCSGAS